MTRAALFLSLCLPTFSQDAPDDLLRTLPTAGVAVQIGWDEASPAIRRAEQGGWLVHVLVADEGKAGAARQRLEGRGLYGRVSVEAWTAATLPYPDNLVNLLVVHDAAVPEAELRRVVAPGGGLWA